MAGESDYCARFDRISARIERTSVMVKASDGGQYTHRRCNFIGKRHIRAAMLHGHPGKAVQNTGMPRKEESDQARGQADTGAEQVIYA